MLRKTANILLLTLFLFTTMGFTITQHYCGNRLISISLKNVNECCKNCNQCHNKVSHIKINDLFDTNADALTVVDYSIYVATPAYICDYLFAEFGNALTIFNDTSPPPLIHSNSFLQVFRN